jgi:hypothetical protein
MSSNGAIKAFMELRDSKIALIEEQLMDKSCVYIPMARVYCDVWGHRALICLDSTYIDHIEDAMLPKSAYRQAVGALDEGLNAILGLLSKVNESEKMIHSTGFGNNSVGFKHPLADVYLMVLEDKVVGHQIRLTNIMSRLTGLNSTFMSATAMLSGTYSGLWEARDQLIKKMGGK